MPFQYFFSLQEHYTVRIEKELRKCFAVILCYVRHISKGLYVKEANSCSLVQCPPLEISIIGQLFCQLIHIMHDFSPTRGTYVTFISVIILSHYETDWRSKNTDTPKNNKFDGAASIEILINSLEGGEEVGVGWDTSYRFQVDKWCAGINF